MNRLQEFMTHYEPDRAESDVPVSDRCSVPVKSLVKVRFVNRHMHLSYYNDRFDLREGDVVYVSGKLAGEPGVVTSVTTRFRIHTSDFEKVLVLLDLTLHGSFVQAGNWMVSFDQIPISPERFDSWVNPPEDPKQKKQREKDGEEEDEVVSGEGYTIDIHHPERCQEMTDTIAGRALDYCEEGRVRYLCIRDGAGCAYVRGGKWYRVDFRFKDGIMTDLFCDCPCSELCKHEAAVAVTLWMLFRQSQLHEAGAFMALNRHTFLQLAARKKTIVL